MSVHFPSIHCHQRELFLAPSTRSTQSQCKTTLNGFAALFVDCGRRRRRQWEKRQFRSSRQTAAHAATAAATEAMQQLQQQHQ